jgi:LuxR family transcriptional regulator, maltose regulon positive regulatory protein
MGLALTARDVAALEGRTEGWVAALQLAALSMRGRDDVSGFIAGFAGDDRYIVDYLAEEVLERQPEHVHQFLLQTSILDRLSGPLCDAVTGQHGGKAMLESLDRGNLFVVPLDDRRRWYRYHHLFADVLHTYLLDDQPDDVPDLHRRASGWYEQNGEPSQAIRHALAAGTSSEPPVWSSWRSRHCAEAGRRPPSGAGSTPSVTTWSGSGPCSRWALSGR